MAEPYRKLPALTSLRFFAAAAIVVFHSGGHFGFAQPISRRWYLAQGVSFFFILSGFVLHYVYEDVRVTGWSRFLLARLARLWPAHLVAMVLVYILTHRTATFETLLANVAMVQVWDPWHLIDSYNGVAWSISTEFGFYLLFLFLSVNFQRTWPAKLVASLLVALTAVAAAHVVGAGAQATAGLPMFVQLHPLARLVEFVTGMSMAHAWRHLKRRGFAPGTAAGTALEVAAFGLMLGVCAHSRAMSALVQPWLGDVGVEWMDRSIVCLPVFAAVLLVVALEVGAISRLLSAPALVLLGEMSYSVYLTHQTLIDYFTAQESLRRWPTEVVYFVFWLVLLLLSYMIWAGVEVPLRARMVAWGTRHSIWLGEVEGHPWRVALVLGCLVMGLSVVASMRQQAPVLDGVPSIVKSGATEEGFVDVVRNDTIAGWAWDAARPDAALDVDIMDGTRLLGTVHASDFREDLLAAGKGNGYHAFTFHPWLGWNIANSPHHIVIQLRLLTRFSDVKKRQSAGQRWIAAFCWPVRCCWRHG